MAILRQKEVRSRDYALLLFRMIQGFFIVHSTIDSTVHSMPFNSLEHCICTTMMTNIRPDRDSNLVPPGYKPQSIRMSHRGRPGLVEQAVIIVNFGGRQGSLSFPFNIKTFQNWSFWLRLKPRFVCFHTLAATLRYQNPYKYSWKCISTTTSFLYQNYRAYICVTFLVKLFLL